VLVVNDSSGATFYSRPTKIIFNAKSEGGLALRGN